LRTQLLREFRFRRRKEFLSTCYLLDLLEWEIGVLDVERGSAAESATTPEMRIYDPLPGQQQGREGLKQVINAFRTAFPDIHWVIEEMVAEGDKVFSRFTWHGVNAGVKIR
jgi:hypothetical protein